ncbi:hypothetical protein JCM6882_004490 [Rhodosporidiobolus microsporus]
MEALYESAQRGLLQEEIRLLQKELARTAAAQSDALRSTSSGGGLGRKRARASEGGGGGSDGADDALRSPVKRSDSGSPELWGPSEEAVAAPPLSDKAQAAAERLGAENCELVGIKFDSSESQVHDRSTNSTIRLHTLNGHVPSFSGPLRFRTHLWVREPTAPTHAGADEDTKPDPGREYSLTDTRFAVKGAHRELKAILKKYRSEPCPASFFALLRQYNRLSDARDEFFRKLFVRWSPLARGNGHVAGYAQAVFRDIDAWDTAPHLVLSYRLVLSTAPTSIRKFQPLVPLLTLSAVLEKPTSASSRAALDAIPEQFERMLREGVDPHEAVEAIATAVFPKYQGYWPDEI